MKAIRILIADDHAVLSAGLEAMLNTQPDMQVVSIAGDGLICVRQAVLLQPDIILLDINMPNCNGLEALAMLGSQAPHCKVLVLTMHDDAGYLRQVMAGGAAGYVLKQSAGSELLAAIRAVYQGGVYLHPTHARSLMNPAAGAEPSQDPAASSELQQRLHLLSERELQIFRLVALGYRNQEIGVELSLSVKTVETYKSRLMQKLELSSRIQLVRFAMEAGLLD
jgi:two-component system, NarL family, response regulator NreC